MPTEIKINPEREYKAIPETLSSYSKIVEVSEFTSKDSIILDSVDEVVQALTLYGTGSIPGSRNKEKELLDDFERNHGSLAVGMAVMAGLQNANGFTEALINDVKKALASEKRYDRDFDYDALGTPFFKSYVKINMWKGKYVVRMPNEAEIASQLGKPMGVWHAGTIANMSNVDDWWFNINLEDVLKGLPLVKQVNSLLRTKHVPLDSKDVEGILEDLATHGYGRHVPDVRVVYCGHPFVVKINLAAITYVKPEGSQDYYGTQKRGTDLVGPSWGIYADDGNTKIAPEPIQSGISLSVTTERKKTWLPEISPIQIKLMHEARDVLKEELKKKISQ